MANRVIKGVIRALQPPGEEGQSWMAAKTKNRPGWPRESSVALEGVANGLMYMHREGKPQADQPSDLVGWGERRAAKCQEVYWSEGQAGPQQCTVFVTRGRVAIISGALGKRHTANVLETMAAAVIAGCWGDTGLPERPPSHSTLGVTACYREGSPGAGPRAAGMAPEWIEALQGGRICLYDHKGGEATPCLTRTSNQRGYGCTVYHGFTGRERDKEVTLVIAWDGRVTVMGWACVEGTRELVREGARAFLSGKGTDEIIMASARIVPVYGLRTQAGPPTMQSCVPLQGVQGLPQGRVNQAQPHAAALHTERQPDTGMHTEGQPDTGMHTEGQPGTGMHTEGQPGTGMHTERQPDTGMHTERQPGRAPHHAAALYTECRPGTGWLQRVVDGSMQCMGDKARPTFWAIGRAEGGSAQDVAGQVIRAVASRNAWRDIRVFPSSWHGAPGQNCCHSVAEGLDAENRVRACHACVCEHPGTGERCLGFFDGNLGWHVMRRDRGMHRALEGALQAGEGCRKGVPPTREAWVEAMRGMLAGTTRGGRAVECMPVHCGYRGREDSVAGVRDLLVRMAQEQGGSGADATAGATETPDGRWMVLGAIDRGHNARAHGSRRENDSLLMWMEVRDAMAAVGVDSYYAVLERIRDALGMDMQEYLQAQIDG